MQRAWRYLKTAVRTHPFNFFTLIIALLAAVYALWSASEAHRQAVAAEGARTDAQKASLEQKADVERSRKAAEVSAEASKELAEAMKQNAGASQTTAEASKASARSAQRAAHFSETSFQTSHRAYMILETAQLDSLPSETEPWRLTMTFKNVGQTPALDVTASWGFFLIPVQNLRPLDHLSLPPLGHDNIGPSLTFIAQSRANFSPSEKRLLINKERFLAVLSTVYYKDIFGTLHYSEWCGGWHSSQTSLALTFCPDAIFQNPQMN